MQEPYNYQTLLAELHTHHDLVTSIDHKAVWHGTVFAYDTWRRAIWEVVVPDGTNSTIWAHAVAWSCYLHPATDDEIDDYVHRTYLNVERLREDKFGAVTVHRALIHMLFRDSGAPGYNRNSHKHCDALRDYLVVKG